MEQLALRYEVTTQSVFFRGKQITLTNRTPVFTPEQREKQKRLIEQRLYDAVCGYRKNA
jgi:hypothetical protein